MKVIQEIPLNDFEYDLIHTLLYGKTHKTETLETLNDCLDVNGKRVNVREFINRGTYPSKNGDPADLMARIPAQKYNFIRVAGREQHYALTAMRYDWVWVEFMRGDWLSPDKELIWTVGHYASYADAVFGVIKHALENGIVLPNIGCVVDGKPDVIWDIEGECL